MKKFEHYLNKVKKNKINELRSVSVKYSDGTVINTDMASHLTDDEIRDYYKIGKQFNLGNAPVKGDDPVVYTPVFEVSKTLPSVEFAPDTT